MLIFNKKILYPSLGKVKSYFWLVFLASFASFNVCYGDSSIRSVDFDQPGGGIAEKNNSYRLFNQGKNVFHMPYQGVSLAPHLSNRSPVSGGHSLELSIGPSAAGQTINDRSEFTVTHQQDSWGLHLGEDRYLGYMIYFDRKSFPPPQGQIIVSQVWQAYKKEKVGPPAFIVMKPLSDSLEFFLATRNDSGDKSSQVKLKDSHFEWNKWNSVVLHVLPREINNPKGPGQIEMWLNGEYLGGDKRYWGYASNNSLNAFDVRVGLYGVPQKESHTIWVDKIRWGDSLQAVDPGLKVDGK